MWLSTMLNKYILLKLIIICNNWKHIIVSIALFSHAYCDAYKLYTS